MKVSKEALKNLGVMIDEVINDESENFGYVLLVFPFENVLGTSIDYLSNTKENDLHQILQTAADFVEEIEDFATKESFEDTDNH